MLCIACAFGLDDVLRYNTHLSDALRYYIPLINQTTAAGTASIYQSATPSIKTKTETINLTLFLPYAAHTVSMSLLSLASVPVPSGIIRLLRAFRIIRFEPAWCPQQSLPPLSLGFFLPYSSWCHNSLSLFPYVCCVSAFAWISPLYLSVSAL